MGLEEKRQTREIDGVTYAVTPLPFGVGQKALIRTLKVLSPIMAAALKDRANGATGAAIFETLPGALTEEDVAWFAKVFGDASQFQLEGKWIPLLVDQQELHFAGRYLAFFKW